MSNSKLAVDVVRGRERLVEPGHREIVSALASAGHEVELRETHVRLSPRFPYVDKKVWLEWGSPTLWTFMLGYEDQATWWPAQSYNYMYMQINIQGLTVGATYAVSVLVESWPLGAKPLFTVYGGGVNGPVWSFEVPAKPRQVFVVPIMA